MWLRCWLWGCISLVFGLNFPVMAASSDVDHVTEEVRSELMAPCCWRGTLLEHSSPQADQMSGEIRSMAEKGMSRQQILDHFVAQHGEAILARPRTKGFGLVFYAGPALLLALTGLWLWRRGIPGLTRNPVMATSPSTPLSSTSSELDKTFEQELRRLS